MRVLDCRFNPELKVLYLADNSGWIYERMPARKYVMWKTKRMGPCIDWFYRFKNMKHRLLLLSAIVLLAVAGCSRDEERDGMSDLGNVGIPDPAPFHKRQTLGCRCFGRLCDRLYEISHVFYLSFCFDLIRIYDNISALFTEMFCGKCLMCSVIVGYDKNIVKII